MSVISELIMSDVMRRETFERFRELIYAQTGIALKPGKETLVRARVSKRMRALDLPTPEAYLEFVLAAPDGREVELLIDAISTNVTAFFREPVHFDFLAKQFQEWVRAGLGSLRLWCAGCSTGEEPYTLAICALEATRGTGTQIKILATDISRRVLDIAERGEYTQRKVAALGPQLRQQYLEHVGGKREESIYRVRDEVRRLVSFRRLNLATPPFGLREPLDVILCRNVMIYFDQPIRQALMDAFTQVLRPGGLLLVGHAESMTSLSTSLARVIPAVYKRR